MKKTRRFALDQGFPLAIVRCLQEYLPSFVELLHLSEIDPALCRDMADWEVLLSLHHLEPRFDGLIAVDSSILRQPREICVIDQTRMTLVVAERAGHNPVVATGLLLTHLRQIAEGNTGARGQVWRLKTSSSPKLYDTSHRFIESLAKRRGEEARDLRLKHELGSDELKTSPLERLQQ